MEDVWRMNSHMESVIKAYKTLSKIPSIVGGRLNDKGNRITSKWSVRNLDKGKNTNYHIDYVLDGKLEVVAKSQFGVDISHELLTAVSPKENFKAVIREEKDEKDSAKKKFFLEVWSHSCLKHSIDLSAMDLHGDVYTDTEFGSLDWSPDETKIAYVAEKKVKKSEPFIKRQPGDMKMFENEKKPVPGQEHLYREDWGEQLTGKFESVVVVCDITQELLTVLDGVPGCTGQVRFTPTGEGLVGVTWEAKAIGRLGLMYCTNRSSYIFYVSLFGPIKILSAEEKAVRSPRFSPNGDLLWLQRVATGPHHSCHELVKLSAKDLKDVLESEDDEHMGEKVSVVIDIVKIQEQISNGIFYGIYCQHLPSKCFSADGKRLIFSTQQQTEIRSYVVDIESGRMVDISNNKKFSGSTTVMCVQSDVILATFSNMTTPGQLFVARLPGAEKESDIEWTRVSCPIEVPSSVANAKLQYMTLKRDSENAIVSTYTAIYFGPDEGKVYPLVVWPHGGPHSAFSNTYSLEAAFFNMIGFASVRINYRGSTGNGDTNLRCLMGNVGDFDVNDCLLTLEVLKEQHKLLAEHCLLYGGSFGGFIAGHLAGRFSELFRAMVLRNPVIDLVSKVNCADNPDGCSVEVGWPFSEEGPMEEDRLLALRRASPIVHAHNVMIPTALMLGSKDKRVPYYQGLEYARRLRANGVKVAVYMYDDNHSLSSIPAEMDNLINAADWYIKHIKP